MVPLFTETSELCTRDWRTTDYRFAGAMWIIAAAAVATAAALCAWLRHTAHMSDC